MSKQEILLTKELPTIIGTTDIYDYFWQLPKNWFEAPNYRRGGWSGVIKYDLPHNQFIDVPVFVKLQSNSVYKTIKHPFKGQPTLLREFINTQNAIEAGVKTLDFVYFARDDFDAILVSKSLEGYQDLTQALFSIKDNVAVRNTIIKLLSDNLCAMHQAKIKHGSLYGKHVLVKINGNNVDLRFIDFEKARHSRSMMSCIVRDIYSLFKHCDQLTEEDYQYLMKQYQNICDISYLEKIEYKLKKYQKRKLK